MRGAAGAVAERVGLGRDRPARLSAAGSGLFRSTSALSVHFLPTFAILRAESS